jgi:hypothetical protein
MLGWTQLMEASTFPGIFWTQASLAPFIYGNEIVSCFLFQQFVNTVRRTYIPKHY